jgi:hypothetical protein
MCILESGGVVHDNDYYISLYLPRREVGTGVTVQSGSSGSKFNNNPDLGVKGKKVLFMPGRFRERASYWKGLGANDMVMDWIENGFMARFHKECPRMSKKNQESCFEPVEHTVFISESVAQLLERGVIGEWDPAWGSPHIMSPLKVVPKKGGLFRLILDLSFLNRSLAFPKFKYDNIKNAGGVFEADDYLFAWDLKDGYWHTELHPNMFKYMCFEWEGKVYYFRMMPFGLAPACWVFTKIIRVLVDSWRGKGLACMSYIDDGVAGAQGREKALYYRNLVIETLVDSGWFINWVKSKWDLAREAEFIGYVVGTAGPLGYLQPSESRMDKLEKGINRILKARTVSARLVAQLAGYIVSLRPVFDPMALLFSKHMYIWINRTVEAWGWDHRVEFQGEAREEVRVWKVWLFRWIRKPLWADGKPPVWVQAQDASDTGVGGWLGRLGGLDLETDKKGRTHIVGYSSEALEAVGKLDKWDQDQSSTYRELYALFFMIDSFKEIIQGSTVLIQADNRALFFICSTGRTRAMVIHALLVDLFWLCINYGIAWDIVWIPRELNQYADDLSKFIDLDDWGLTPSSWREIVSVFRRFGLEFTCDRFASEKNRVLDCFCALHHCPGVWFVDCFSGSWVEGFSWWHPNPREVPKILAKVRRDRARGALLLPLWPGAWWWLKLCPDGRHFGDLVKGWFELERTGSLFIKGPSNSFWSRESPRTRILVVWLDGSSKQTGCAGRLGFCALGGCLECRLSGCFL